MDKGERQDLRVTQALWTLLTAVSGLSDEHERARLIATGLPALLPCSVSGLALLNQAGTGWSLVLQKDGQQLDSSEAEAVLADLEPFFLETFRQPALQILTAENETKIHQIPASIEKLGVREVAAVPLMTLHSRIGALLAGRDVSGAFSQQDRFFLLTLAEHSALGFENLRLAQMQKQYAEKLQDLVNERTEALRKSEERHRVLLEINNAIIAHLDRESLFNAIAESLRKVLPFDRASLTLLDPKKDTLRVYALAGFIEPRKVFPIGSEFPRKGSHLAPVFEHKRPFLRRDLETEPRIGLEDFLLTEGIRSYVAVPLMAKQEPFGTLNVASLIPDVYSEADAEFLMEAGQQVALAIENTLAFEEIAQLKARLEQENVYLQEEIRTEVGYTDLIGQSPALRNVLRQVEMVAPTDAGVLILGESGTGKELVAREIHKRSHRHSRPLVRVNCASIPRDLYESEFFGHVKGAFTGAIKDRAGRFELADGGTLFLDEVGEIPLELQSKLLRVLQEQQYERVGDERTRQVDVRVIAATNRDLKKEVEAGRFRQDLFYRLNVFPIEVAPLRRRKEDIPLLAEHFLVLAAQKLNCPRPRLKEADLIKLQTYDWPGNVRELQNVIERAVITLRGGFLHLDLPVTQIPEDSLPSAVAWAASVRDVIPEAEMQRRERDNVLAALQRTRWRIYGPGGAAELLGIKPTTLLSRMRKMGLKKPN